MRPILRQFLNKDLIIAYLYRGGGVLLTFVLNIVLARVYGPSLSGEYYVLYNFLALVASISFLGFGYVIVHFLTPHYGENGDHEKGNLLLTISLTMLLAMVCITGAAVYIFRGSLSVYLFGNPGRENLISLVIVALIPYSGIFLLAEMLKALKKPNQSILAANIIGNGILIGLLLLYRGTDILRIYSCFIIANALSVLLLVVSFRRLFKSRGVKVLPPKEVRELYPENRALCRDYVKENLTLSLVAVSNILLSVFDTFVISHQLTFTDVALYSIANKVVSFGSIILTTVNSLIGFQIADLSYKNDKKNLSGILVKYTRIMMPLGVVYYIVAAVFALAVPFLFGQEYRSSIELCYLLALGQFISIITGPCSYFAIMTGHARKYTEIVITSAAISVVANLVLVPLLGIHGAVISNLITLAYKNVHTFIFTKNLVNLKIADFLRLRGC